MATRLFNWRRNGEKSETMRRRLWPWGPSPARRGGASAPLLLLPAALRPRLSFARPTEVNICMHPPRGPALRRHAQAPSQKQRGRGERRAGRAGRAEPLLTSPQSAARPPGRQGGFLPPEEPGLFLQDPSQEKRPAAKPRSPPGISKARIPPKRHGPKTQGLDAADMK